MRTVQFYGQEALERVQTFMDSNGVVLGALKNTPARALLDAAVTQLAAHALDQGTAVRQAAGQMERQRQAVNTLREAHMQPIAKFARANLQGVPDLAALTDTGGNVRGNALVLAAREMATAAAPYLAKLTEAQFPANTLDQLAAAATDVATAISDRAGSKSQRVGATAGIKEALTNGRQAIEMLDPIVSKMLAGNAALLASWRVAKRITAKPGVVSAGGAAAGAAASTAPVGAGAPLATPLVASPASSVEVAVAKVA